MNPREKSDTTTLSGPRAQQQQQQEQDDEDPVELNVLNALNILFFFLNVLFTYGIGVLGWFGNGSNADISEKYQTLVTPNAAAFSIWGVIFGSEALFVVLQSLERFRATPIIQQGVGYWFVWTCAFQAAWSIAFSYEMITLSLILILGVWIFLVGLVVSQHRVPPSTIAEYFQFRFPFDLHCGWLTAAAVVAINLQLVDMAPNKAVAQLALGIVSLAYVHAVSACLLFVPNKTPNFTIASVLAWASGWIHVELLHPKQSIAERFDAITIEGVSYAALAVSIVILVQIVVRVLLDLKRTSTRFSNYTFMPLLTSDEEEVSNSVQDRLLERQDGTPYVEFPNQSL